MHVSIYGKIPPIPPPPIYQINEKSNDTCVEENAYKVLLDEYIRFRKFSFEMSYASLDTVDVRLGICDTLFVLSKSYINYIVELKIEREYKEILNTINERGIVKECFSLNEIKNTKNVKLISKTDLGWSWETSREFWKEKSEENYHFAGIIHLSKIYLNENMDRGILICYIIDGAIEPWSNLILIKKIDNNWIVYKSLFI